MAVPQCQLPILYRVLLVFSGLVGRGLLQQYWKWTLSYQPPETRWLWPSPPEGDAEQPTACGLSRYSGQIAAESHNQKCVCMGNVLIDDKILILTPVHSVLKGLNSRCETLLLNYCSAESEPVRLRVDNEAVTTRVYWSTKKDQRVRKSLYDFTCTRARKSIHHYNIALDFK